MGQKIAAERKEAILKKALARGDKPLTLIARECGIGKSTLSNWVAMLKQPGASAGNKRDKIPGRAEQFTHLQAVAKLSEDEVGAYCRQHGIYSFQLKEWAEAFMKADDNKAAQLAERTEIKALRAENVHLQRELRRKEKALAEAEHC